MASCFVNKAPKCRLSSKSRARHRRVDLRGRPDRPPGSRRRRLRVVEATAVAAAQAAVTWSSALAGRICQRAQRGARSGTIGRRADPAPSDLRVTAATRQPATITTTTNKTRTTATTAWKGRIRTPGGHGPRRLGCTPQVLRRRRAAVLRLRPVRLSLVPRFFADGQVSPRYLKGSERVWFSHFVYRLRKMQLDFVRCRQVSVCFILFILCVSHSRRWMSVCSGWRATRTRFRCKSRS